MVDKPTAHLLHCEVTLSCQLTKGYSQRVAVLTASLALVDLMTRCWAQRPGARPAFPAIIEELKYVDTHQTQVRLTSLQDSIVSSRELKKSLTSGTMTSMLTLRS